MSTSYGQSTVIEGIDQAIQSIEEQIRSQQAPPHEEQTGEVQGGFGAAIPSRTTHSCASAPSARFTVPWGIRADASAVPTGSTAGRASGNGAGCPGERQPR
jgi:hypothetical protein